MELRFVAAVIIGLLAVVFDVRRGRIPNGLTFGGAAAAFSYGIAMHGLNGGGLAAAGWLTGAALFFPFFALGGMGAGDVKLLAALAAWLGPADGVWLAVFASIAGGALALAVAISTGYLRQAIGNVWLMLTHWRVVGLGPVDGMTLRDSQGPRLAYAIPITIGVLCTLWRQ